jgi:hypothetical protein
LVLFQALILSYATSSCCALPARGFVTSPIAADATGSAALSAAAKVRLKVLKPASEVTKLSISRLSIINTKLFISRLASTSSKFTGLEVIFRVLDGVIDGLLKGTDPVPKAIDPDLKAIAGLPTLSIDIGGLTLSIPIRLAIN